jgi:hypothetical protein
LVSDCLLSLADGAPAVPGGPDQAYPAAGPEIQPAETAVAVAELGTSWGIELGAEFEFQVRFWGDSARFVRETLFYPGQQLTEQPDGSVCLKAPAYGLHPVGVDFWRRGGGLEAGRVAADGGRGSAGRGGEVWRLFGVGLGG